MIYCIIRDHLTVGCLVTRHLYGSEAGGDLDTDQTVCVFVNQVVLMLTVCIYMRKAERCVSM